MQRQAEDQILAMRDLDPEQARRDYGDDAGHLIPEDVPRTEMLASAAAEIREVFAELARRKIEALNLYEPLPAQDAFHASQAPERILRGSNRGGKTLPAAVEIARAVTGQDPYGKYSRRDGRVFAVGKDGKHLGDVMYRKLFKPGAFRIIRDKHTNEWRAYRPWTDEDRERLKESRPAPPLIPKRFCDTNRDVAWENKKANIPAIARMTTGWEISFFSSLGKPPQGSDIDLGWFDEEIEDQEWYPEVSARLVDRMGRFIWSATPQAGTEQLYALSCTAEDLRGTFAPRVEEFYMALDANPHIPQAAKDLLAAKYTSPEQFLVRIKGEFAIVSLRVYPELAQGIHYCRYFDIPQEWCHYAAVDPGHQVCAVTFIAVPPPEVGKQKYVYDEIYIQRCTAQKFGEAMGMKCQGRRFQAFLIDGHAGRITDIGGGQTIESQYAAALKDNKVASISTGNGFMWGSDNVEAGIESVRSWLQIQNGKPTILVFGDRCPNWKREMERYHYKKISGLVTNKPNQRDNHLPDTTRYLAMFGCPYVKPPSAVKRDSAAVKAVKAKKERARMKENGGSGAYVNLGPRAS